MGLFGRQRKVTAAVRSMHQYCPAVRAVYCDLLGDEIVEAVTAFLYVKMAEEVFDRKFALQVRNQLRFLYKFADGEAIEDRLASLCESVEHFQQAEGAGTGPRSSPDQYTSQVRCVLKAMLLQGGFSYEDEELVRDMFPRFEDAVRKLRDHLQGIRRQSNFIMKS